MKNIKKNRIIFGALFLFIVGIGFLIATQSYPIVLVGWRLISLKSFEKNFIIAKNHHKKILEVYDKDNSGVVDSNEVKRKIEGAILDKLIEDILIQRELRKRFKKDEYGKMVNDALEKALEGKNIEKEIEALYGISFNEFKELFLEPQAKREVLESRLLLESSSSISEFSDWLKDVKSKTKIRIFLPGFSWKDGQVVALN